MLKKILSLLILLFFVFSLTFSAYPGSGDKPDPRGHPWDDVNGIQPVPENEDWYVVINLNFNWAPYFTVLVYKTNSCSSEQLQERTKKEVRKGEAKSFQKPNSEKER